MLGPYPQRFRDPAAMRCIISRDGRDSRIARVRRRCTSLTSGCGKETSDATSPTAHAQPPANVGASRKETWHATSPRARARYTSGPAGDVLGEAAPGILGMHRPRSPSPIIVP